MSLPPVPAGYDSWNQFIEEQGAIIAFQQGLTFQQGKASAKLLYAAMPLRQDPSSPDFMIYNVFTTWADRTVAPTIGRPWRLGNPPDPGSIIITENGDALVTTQTGDFIVTT
jgi:hypothetical protein